MNMRAQTKTTIMITGISTLLALLWLLPIVYTLFVSFKHAARGISVLGKLVSPPYTLDNYIYVLNSGQADIFGWTFNSFLISTVVTLSVIIVCSTAAFAFAFLHFTGKHVLFWVALFGLILPGEAILVPLYILMRDLKLLNTYASLIFPYVAAPFALIIFRQFFVGIPRELFEAARIDGCGSWKIYRSVVLPLSRPVLAAIGIFVFLGIWNDFVWPYISITKQELMTIPVGLPFFISQFNPDVGMPIAAAMLATAPVLIVFLFFQRFIVKGITFTGIKG
jgi:multiple sugar transport system permease protein